MSSEVAVLDEVVASWNHEPGHASRAKREYARNASLAPSEILRRLRSRFSEGEIGTAVAAFLDHAASIEERKARPTAREVFLLGCCLLLAGHDAGPDLPLPLVQRLVGSLPVALASSSMAPVIARHLDRAQLLAALNEGLDGCTDTDLVENRLNGVFMYAGLGLDDKNAARPLPEATRLRESIDRLDLSRRADLRRLAERARSWLGDAS